MSQPTAVGGPQHAVIQAPRLFLSCGSTIFSMWLGVHPIQLADGEERLGRHTHLLTTSVLKRCTPLPLTVYWPELVTWPYLYARGAGKCSPSLTSHLPATTLWYGKGAKLLGGHLDLVQHPHFQRVTWKWPESGIVLPKVIQWVGTGGCVGVCLPSLSRDDVGAGITIIP